MGSAVRVEAVERVAAIRVEDDEILHVKRGELAGLAASVEAARQREDLGLVNAEQGLHTPACG